MSEETMPADWVLIEAAKRFCDDRAWGPSSNIGWAREDYDQQPGYRALCDMIAKHEQPPVDPDVEAVKRIMAKWYDVEPHELRYWDGEHLDSAVAQYKLERAK